MGCKELAVSGLLTRFAYRHGAKCQMLTWRGFGMLLFFGGRAIAEVRLLFTICCRRADGWNDGPYPRHIAQRQIQIRYITGRRANQDPIQQAHARSIRSSCLCYSVDLRPLEMQDFRKSIRCDLESEAGECYTADPPYAVFGFALAGIKSPISFFWDFHSFSALNRRYLKPPTRSVDPRLGRFRAS